MRFALLLVVLALYLPHLAAQTPGVVIDTVVCKNNPAQSYALYVPRGYYPSPTPPGLILMFEPGARGKLPVSLYKTIADKYNVILACSNNSRNGPVEQSLMAGEAVLIDVLSRFSVDRRFIITSGFSGGGRTAVTMATDNKGFAGIIACGAAFPRQNAFTKNNYIPFAEVIGRVDMNYQEALIADRYIQYLEKPNTLLMFDGGHQWPPAESYEHALVWHYLRIIDNDTIAKANYDSRLSEAIVQLDSGNLYEAHRMLTQLKRDFKSDRSIKKTDSVLIKLSENKKLKSELKDVARMDETERLMQRDMSAQFAQHMAYAAPDSAFHPEYWTNYYRDCSKLIASREKYKKIAGARLLDFGWRMCAEQHYMYIEYGQFRQAAMAARIWVLLSPDKPGPCVEAARAYALLGRRGEMLYYLRLASEVGIENKAALRNDRAFERYSEDPGFLKLLK